MEYKMEFIEFRTGGEKCVNKNFNFKIVLILKIKERPTCFVPINKCLDWFVVNFGFNVQH